MAIPANNLIKTHSLFALADKLKELRDRKKSLEDELKALNREIDETEQALVDAMLEEEMQNFVRAGQMFSLQTKTYANAVPERKQELLAWLKKNGYGDLVQETVNANSLAAFVRELLEEADELPEELRELVNVYEKTTIGIRRAK